LEDCSQILKLPCGKKQVLFLVHFISLETVTDPYSCDYFVPIVLSFYEVDIKTSWLFLLDGMFLCAEVLAMGRLRARLWKYSLK